MRTVILSFSLRQNGNCARIGKFIQGLTKDSAFFDFSEFSLHPCGRCDYECFTERTQCPYIGDRECEILEAIVQSEMTYFILPNYCDYPCSNYFIFNERSQCYFQGRPELLDAYLNVPKHCIAVSSTDTENIAGAFAYQTAHDPDILFLSAEQYGKKSTDGDLMTSEKAMAEITAFVRRTAELH